jgi:predicted house-cleaning noncanonical NTP pyrophosphatase (MazG superfamily)
MRTSTARKTKEHARPGQSANSGRVVLHLAKTTDAMHSLLVKRADELAGCAEGSPEEAELASLIEVIEAYEAQRWPAGKIPGGKG